MIKASDIRRKYLDFFEKRKHVVIPSAPVVPENDPTVLFTTAGMHPLVPYLLGQPHPAGRRLVDYQKCVRTDDIEEVGDISHHTFFEMLGNWSLGDYFKEEMIPWSYEFLTKELGISVERIFVTCFEGDADAPKDEESAQIWESLGIPRERIYFFGKKDNWWGPAGQTGPCGPDTEMHYDITQKPCGPDCKPGCDCGRFYEIWNDVFMEYNKTAGGKFEKLSKPNVDTGMGLERTTAVLNGLDDNYLTDLWQPIIAKISQVSNREYEDHKRPFRIIADHIRAAVFIINDGVIPSNKLQGYVLRRLIRRAAVQLHGLGVDPTQSSLEIAELVVETMKAYYPDLDISRASEVIKAEVNKFKSTLAKGLKEIDKHQQLNGKVAFDLFQTYGFPVELTLEIAQGKGQEISREEFDDEFRKHQESSRTASAGMFKGGLADQSETTTKYHTATHLLHSSLRKVLGDHVQQKGSNITAERLRFDFSNTKKLTEEELKKVESLINQKISENIPVEKLEIDKQQALDMGALAFFPEKYPDKTSVYKIGDFSLELCGGPHVQSTGEIGRIKLSRQDQIGTGVVRLYAQLG